MSCLNGCWIKFFVDGNKEYGYDSQIQKKTASWSKGRLAGIKEVFLSEGSSSCTLETPNTEYHQFDRFFCQLAIGKTIPVRKARYIQALITEEHVGLYLCYNNDSICASWCSLKKKPVSLYYRINKGDIGQWITFCISSNSISQLFLADKGGLNGKQLFK